MAVYCHLKESQSLLDVFLERNTFFNYYDIQLGRELMSQRFPYRAVVPASLLASSGNRERPLRLNIVARIMATVIACSKVSYQHADSSQAS